MIKWDPKKRRFHVRVARRVKGKPVEKNRYLIVERGRSKRAVERQAKRIEVELIEAIEVEKELAESEEATKGNWTHTLVPRNHVILSTRNKANGDIPDGPVVYVIEPSDGWAITYDNVVLPLVKLGKASSIKNRLSDYHTAGGGIVYRVRGYWACETIEEAAALEADLKMKYAALRCQGEWYVLEAPLIDDVPANGFERPPILVGPRFPLQPDKSIDHVLGEISESAAEEHGRIEEVLRLLGPLEVGKEKPVVTWSELCRRCTLGEATLYRVLQQLVKVKRVIEFGPATNKCYRMWLDESCSSERSQ